MPAPSSFSSIAARLFSSAIRKQQQQQLCHPPSFSDNTLLVRCCFSSKAKDKAKGKSGSAEKEAPPPPAAEKKSSNKKPHWSQQVFYKVSARLIPVLDCKEATRPEAIERMWDYIKTNNLQKDNDEIVCDEALKKAFGQAKVQRSEILKFLDVNLTRLKPGCHA